MVLTEMDRTSLRTAASLFRGVLAAHAGHEKDRGFYLLSRAGGYVTSVLDSDRVSVARAEVPGVVEVIKPEDLRTKVTPGHD
jgi:hypothetical protein